MRASRVERETAGPGQESVWDYPRPPRLERTAAHITVDLGGRRIADTTSAWRVLETSHPPVYYLPLGDIAAEVLERSEQRSYCEWKGEAEYWSVRVGARVEVDAAWSYRHPLPGFEPMADHVAFYCGRMDRATVDGEAALPQPGGFYGGWVTSAVAGPFKGVPGSWGW